MAARALLAAGVDPGGGSLAAAINWLDGAELRGTCPLAERVRALAAVPGTEHLTRLTRDVARLVEGAAEDGSYGDALSGEGDNRAYDDESTQAAVLAVAAGAGCGTYVPAEYWQRVDAFLRSQQQTDGGWCYRLRPHMWTEGTYGSITAACLAALYACQDNSPPPPLGRSGLPQEDESIAAALAWLDRNYDVRANPGKGAQGYYRWLCALSQAAAANGYRHIAGHNWYAEGAAELLARQNRDGSWGHGDRAADTAYAVLFLTAASRPAALSKLRYAGKWNPRPRDLASLARYLSGVFERPVGWQIVDPDAPLEDLCDSPVIYISGSGPCQLTGEQLDKLRAFALRGGLIFCEAASDNSDFTLDLTANLKRMFPDCQLAPLPEDHPLYSLHFTPAGLPPLLAVMNGERVLAVLSVRDVSGALQRGPAGGDLPWFELLANAYIYATGMGRPGRHSPAAAVAATAPSGSPAGGRGIRAHAESLHDASQRTLSGSSVNPH